MDQQLASTIDDEADPSSLNLPEPVRLAPVFSQRSLNTFDPSYNSNYKILVPTGKFVNRRSPEKLKVDLDLDEIEDRFENSSVTVAVRVRPFLPYEIERNVRCIVSMKENETMLEQDGNNSLIFCYDYSFWSFNQLSDNYSSQEDVYRQLARPLLEKALEGFNTCLFAYGQTGSGKSYSITGNREQPGIVPRFCGELFSRIEDLQLNTEDPASYKVEISFYEIYNEHIYDLLASQKIRKDRTQLRVREHPVLGPYIEDLSTYVATGYNDVEHWLTLGNRYRATAATGMNDRSSRSHSCFVLLVTQNREVEGEEASRVSKINLVDLAGSERVKTSFTNTERLREGQNINRSLHTLGKVISLLSENEVSHRKHFIPYRDSVLTWLLKESLGGNSKTSMLATISPDHNSSSETTSTLRYAQQARNIVNAAKVNEDPKNRLIRELQAEITRLRSLTVGGKSPGASQIVIKQLKDQLCEKERLMADTTRTWMDRLKMTEQRKLEEVEDLRKAGISLGVENRLPNLVNLNEDPQLSEMLIYVLKEGESTVGRKSVNSEYDIKLTGALVSEKHCTFENICNIVTLIPISDAPTYVNGNLITESLELHHGDRVIIGGDHFFRLNHPVEIEQRIIQSKTTGDGIHGYSFARNELIEKQAARIEAELNEARQEEREKMMDQLNCLKETADQKLSDQRDQYELQLKDLSQKNENYVQEQEVYKEAQGRLSELEARIQMLEDENIAQRHMIQLGELRKQKENEDMRKYHTRLIYELEQEKRKLEEEIFQAREANEKRKVMEFLPQLSGSELVRVSMMLQEANAIASFLGTKVLFTREDIDQSERGELEYNLSSNIGIRLYNKLNKTTTLWELDKFENRLMHMRELYQGEIDPSVLRVSDIFNDPEDQWTKDLGLYTPAKIQSKVHKLVFIDSASTPITPTKLPILPSSLPVSLVNILTTSTEELNSPLHQLSQISGSNSPPATQGSTAHLQPIPDIEITPEIITRKKPRIDITSRSTNSDQGDEGNQLPPLRPSVPPSDLFKHIRSVPELCLERVDRLIVDLKQQRTVTSLEKFLTHAEFLLQFSEDYTESHCKSLSISVPLAESDSLRHAAYNMSSSFEMVVTNGGACCSILFPGTQCDEVCKELLSVGLSMKQLLFSTQPGSRVDVKQSLGQLSLHLESVVKKISQTLLAQLVQNQANSRRSSRGSKMAHEYRSHDLDLQAQQFFSHSGKLSPSISKGAFAYLREVCLQSMHSVSSSHQRAQLIIQDFGVNSLVNSEILSAVCNISLFIRHFISAVTQSSDYIDRNPERLEPLVRRSWAKLVWVLNTLFSIDAGVMRLVKNTQESAEKHGEFEKIVSQANVIAFHTMSATTSLEEINQLGYDLVPSSIKLEPLSKEVIRAAKTLNHLAKKYNGLPTTSLATGQSSLASL